MSMEFSVTHSMAVTAEIAGDFSCLSVGLRVGSQRSKDGVDVAGVQVLAALAGPLTAGVGVWADQLGDLVKPLFGMKAIDDLDGIGEELLGDVPDPLGDGGPPARPGAQSPRGSDRCPKWRRFLWRRCS